MRWTHHSPGSTSVAPRVSSGDTPVSAEAQIIQLLLSLNSFPGLYLSSRVYKNNSVALVRERIIPTELPLLFGEVSANFCGWKVLRGQRNGFPGRINGFLARSRYSFFQVAPQLYSRG
jgi:hypothetical protein